MAVKDPALEFIKNKSVAAVSAGAVKDPALQFARNAALSAGEVKTPALITRKANTIKLPLEEERANEQDKMLVPSVSRQAAQNTPNVVKGKFTGNRQTTYAEPTLGERLRSIGAGAVKQYAGSVAEIPALTVEQQKGTLATGVYREQAAALDKQIAALERSLADPTMTARDIAETNEALKIAREQRGIYGKAVEANEKTGTLAREASKSLTASGAADIENAQKGLGTLGKIAVQAGTAGIQMGMDAALGLATGGGSMLPMVVRSFGGGVQEAAQKGYSTQQQIALGLTTAATEYFTEKLFGGNPVYDTDVGLINRLVGKIAGNGKLMAALNSMPADMLSEGLEEVIADILEPTAEYLITGNKDFATVDQIIADGATGVLLSALGIGGKKLGGAIAGKAQNAPQGASNAATARLEETGGNLTGAAQNAPQNAAESAEMPKAKGLRELEEVKGWNEEAAAMKKTASAGETEIKRKFKSDLDSWMKTTTPEQRAKDGGRFLIGHTSEQLKQADVDDYDIYFGKSKIAKILLNLEMTPQIIKEVSDVVERPIIVMDSKTVPGSITMFGESKTGNGKPVMVSMLLHPTNKTGEILDYGVVTSAYGRRTSNAQNLIDTSNIRYIDPDEKRTGDWMKTLGLQLPSVSSATDSKKTRTTQYTMTGAQNSTVPVINAQSALPQSSSINSMPQSAGNVKMPKAKGLRELEEVKGWNEEAAAGVTLKKVQPTDNDAYKTAKKLGNLTGKKVAWFTETADGTGGTKNGFYDRSTNTIWLNTESGDPVAKIFSHELTHAIEQSEQYESFKQLVFDRKTELGEDIEAQRRAKRALYERHGVNLQSEAEIDSEILAEYVENNLLTNEKEIRRICQTNRSIGQSVLDWINKQLAKLGFRDAKERVYLENAKQLYAEALAESNRTSQRDLDEARAALLESLQRGEITQEEYEDALQGMDIGREAMTGVQFSIKRTSEMTLAEQLKAFYDGKLASSDAFYFGETPEALESAGLDKLPLAITTSDFKKSAKEKHNVPRRVWNNLQKDLKTALFAFTDGNKIGFVTADIDGDGKPLLIGIEKNATMDRKPVNAIKSVYGLDNTEAWLKNQIESGKEFVLLDEKRANAFLQTYGYLASVEDGIRSTDGTVSQNSENSKREFSVSEDREGRELSSKYPQINLNEDISEMDGVPAVELTDGSILPIPYHPSRGSRYTHVEFIEKNKIDVDDLKSGGWIGNGVYEPSFTSDTARYIERQSARKRVAELTGKPYRQFSISETDDGRAVAVVDDDILSHIDTANWDDTKKAQAKKAAKTALLAFKDGVQVNGITYKVNKVSRDEFTRSNDTERLYRKEPEIFADKLRASANANDIITATTSWANDGKLNHPRTDNLVDFAHGEVLIQAGTNQYEAETVVGITDVGEHIFYDVVDMEPTSFKVKEEPSTAATGKDAESAIQESSSADSITDTAENSKREFSISEDSEDGGNKDLIFGKTYGMTSNNLVENVYGMTYEEKLRAGMSERNKLPTKAKNALVRNERYATVAIGEKLGVPKAAQREYMTPLVQELSEEYLKTGSVSKETQDRIFETAYENGIVADNAFYEQYKDVKQKLRGTRVQISEEDTHDIPDYGTWKKSVFGTLNIVKDGGIPVDVLYEEMADMAPELFPTNVIAPSDMLVKMAEVGKSIKKAEKTLEEYYGKDAEEYKRWMRNDFDAAVNRQLSELKTIKAYAEDKNNKIRGPKQITTQEELKDAYMTLKDARRAYEKVNNKALLTDSDKAKVGQLLRGEITLEALNPETDNVKDIKAVYEAKKPYEEVTRVIRDYNKQRKAGLRDVADLFLQTANDWKDKKAGIAYSRETMERNVRDIVPDKELADAIVDTYFKPVHDAQAASTRMKNEFRDRIRKLDLSRKIDEKGGNCVSEAYAVQLYGEAMDNIKMLENSRGKLKMRDGKTLADWQGVVTDLWKENPALDRGKVEMAVEEFRDAYDELFEKMNETRLRNGYEPINYRKGYFPHFQPQQSDGLLGLFGKAIGLQTEVTALPTSINGITHMFKPGIQWFGNAQERLGFSTAYDAVEGFDRYIEGAADVIYQTDNIQKLRALASQVRYRTSDEGIQKQVDEVMASDKLSEEEKKDVIDAIYENGRFKLSNFAVELDEYTNILANKKSKADRSMEQMLGRNMYNVVKAFESRVAANMVAVNPASWLTNFIPITQAWGAVDSRYILSGMWGTLKNYRTSDGMKEVSTFLTNREGSEPLVRTKAQEWSAELSKPMEWIDQFTAGSIVRARFLQNTDRGMSAAEAISDADAFAASVMADRSKGSMPTLFHQSNPLMKALTQFQLEQNNQLSYVFKDLPRDKREEGVKRLVAALLKFFLGAYLYNNVYEFFIGRRPALDPIGILNDSVGDWTGYELPSVAEAIDGMANGERFSEQFRTEKKGRVSALGGAAERTLEELPFVGGLLGGGRVPISSALPDWKNLGKAVFSEDMNAKKRLSTIVKELTGPASYIVLPFGGGQIKKIAQGEYATVRGGSYTVDSKGREVLQYPVYTDTEADIFKNVFVTGLFGKTATKEGQAWIESGFKNLSANETQAYKDMREFETQKKAYALIKETKAVGREAGYKEEVAKILLGSGVNGDAKAELFYNVYAADGEKEKIDAMTEAGATRWEATKMILESKTKDASLETLMMSSKDLTDAEKAEIFLNKFATETQKDAYERYGKSISKTTYYKFISATDGLSSDKDADGKTVKGKSKKDKVLKVINGMDLTVAQKNALYYAAGYKESTLMQDAPWYNLKFRGQD